MPNRQSGKLLVRDAPSQRLGFAVSMVRAAFCRDLRVALACLPPDSSRLCAATPGMGIIAPCHTNAKGRVRPFPSASGPSLVGFCPTLLTTVPSVSAYQDSMESGKCAHPICKRSSTVVCARTCQQCHACVCVQVPKNMQGAAYAGAEFGTGISGETGVRSQQGAQQRAQQRAQSGRGAAIERP